MVVVSDDVPAADGKDGAGLVHYERRKLLVKASPEVKDLYGFDRRTAVTLVAIVAIQWTYALYFAPTHSWWTIAAVAWLLG
jgi:hypothetical protein